MPTGSFGANPVGIFDLYLSAPRTGLDLIARPHIGVFQRIDLAREVGHAQDQSVPSAGRLELTPGHRTRSRCSRPAEQQRAISERHAGERGEVLMVQLEAEMVRVEGDRARDIRYLISHAVDTDDAMGLSMPGFIRSSIAA